MKVGRPNGVFDYPKNHTYVMFDFIDKTTNKCLRALVPNRAAAKTKARNKKVRYRPTHIKSLTDKLGHTKTHKYLKGFGDHWICKGGRIFFEK